MPIRGHSNVQGIGSVGVTPKLKQQIFDALQEKYHLQLPTTAGRDTLACMEAANRYEVKVGFCLGGNLYGSNPDANFAAEALSRLDMNVMMNTTMNSTALTLRSFVNDCSSSTSVSGAGLDGFLGVDGRSRGDISDMK